MGKLLRKSTLFAVMVHEPAVLIEGVLFRARYLGSTQLVCEGRPNKTTRMMQAQEAVTRIKVRKGDRRTSCANKNECEALQKFQAFLR